MNSKVLICGLGTTGKSAMEIFDPLKTDIYVHDDNEKNYENLPKYVSIYSGEDVDYMIKSPGIPLNHPFVKEIAEKGIEIISDIELAYRITECENIIAISGTNGKTTITSLLQEVFQEAGKTSYMGGNVGIGILPLAQKAKKDDILVIECSSFQLETTTTFAPKIAILTNVTEDHLDHHGSLENYQESKKKIFANQKEGDALILNVDDPYLAMLGEEREEAYVVSLHSVQQYGAYESEGELFYNIEGKPTFFMNRKEIGVVGDHNVRNLLEVLLAALLMGVEPESIRKTFQNFRGVEHRIEFVGEHNGVRAYNDSKGTNPDSTMVAVKAMEWDTLLLAGGYNKGSDYHELLESGKNKIKKLYLFGETAEIIEETAQELGYKNIERFPSLKDATLNALVEAKENEAILLSPACASWDQFKNYEERGREFKKLVKQFWKEKMSNGEEE